MFFFGDGSGQTEVNIPVPCLTKRHVILPQILEQNLNKPHRQHFSDQPSKSHVLKELRKWKYGSGKTLYIQLEVIIKMIFFGF